MHINQSPESIARRKFLGQIVLGTGTWLVLPELLRGGENSQVVRFGLIADVHHDTMHDAVRRLSGFVYAMNKSQVDFVCQLGDLCTPRDSSRPLIETYNHFRGPRYHVLGNHDMDSGCTPEQVTAFLAMPSRYYSFDCKGVHFVVLDGNEKGGKKKGYPRFISQKQLSWLADDLEATALPTVVFTHQSPNEPYGGLENGEAIRNVLQQANSKARGNKVLACFCGHHHADKIQQIEGIYYIWINSASYYWTGPEFKHKSYPDEILDRFPKMKKVAPYKKPLWAVVEIDLAKGLIKVEGRQTEWVGPSPEDLGCPVYPGYEGTIVPRITDRSISLSD